MNTLISLACALPAAYAFSRYKFLGDKQMFFWLLTNRMAPAAVFLLPYFQLYSTVNLIDTHIAVALAHCLFNVPLAVWILEGFMSGVSSEIDETAYIDGYSFPLLVGMLIWELVSPTIERRGFLFIPTTRGTRLFIGLLGSGFIHLAWLAMTVLSLWFALAIALVWTVVVMRWG